MLAPAVGHYAFVRDDGLPLDFVPGQYIQVHFRDGNGETLRRSYSLATRHDHALGPGEAVELAVSFVSGGAATAVFEALRPGDRIQASGPYGEFGLRDDDRNGRYLLIATGTGVTPYRSMLPLLEQRIVERDIDVLLLFGARDPQELMYGDEFRAFADAHPRFRFVPCFSRWRPSRELPAPPHPDTRLGHVQRHLPEFAPDPARDIAYLCGNPDMVEASVALLRAAGLPEPRIRYEKYLRGE